MIGLERVSRRWREFAIEDITLQVKEGQYLVVVGPTGAGKTLLLELLLGIHHPDSGRVLIGGTDVTGLPPERRGIGMVYQDYVLFPHLTVEQNLWFGLRYRRWPGERGRKKVRETARLLNIEHLLHRYPYTLSGGEKQRVAIGRALAVEPAVLLLDEPFSALDRGTAHRLRAELKSLHLEKRLTIVHVTHDLAEARQMGDSIALINEGKLNAQGTPEELLRCPPTRFAANFAGAPNLYEGSVREDGGEVRVTAGPIVAAPACRNAGTPHVMILPDEVTLLTGRAAPGTNLLAGEVTGLRDEGNYVSVFVRVEELAGALTVHMSRQTVRSQAVELGAMVTADVSKAIHVLWD
jgi:ABC-type sugar transport system ATPase subunit